MAYSPNDRSSQKPETPSGSPMWVAGFRPLDHLLLLSQGCYQEAGLEVEQLGAATSGISIPYGHWFKTQLLHI